MAGRPPRALEIDVLQAALEVFCAQGIEAPLKTVGERVGGRRRARRRRAERRRRKVTATGA